MRDMTTSELSNKNNIISDNKAITTTNTITYNQ